jgi:branched-chain amino acid transport system substrate-binding protein
MTMKSVIFPLARAVVFAAISYPAGAAEPYPIHVMVPLTGNAAFLGQGEQEALGFAEGLINSTGGIRGRPLKFIYHDDQGSPQVAVQLINEILSSKPAVLIGPSLVAGCRAIAPLVKDGPVDYCLSPGYHPDPDSHVFSSYASTTDLIEVQLRYFRLKGIRRLALLVSTDATGQDAETGFKEALAQPENKDMQLVQLAHFAVGDVSVAAQIEAIKAADPQCLVAWSTGAPIGTVFRAIRDAGLDIPIATTGANLIYKLMEQYSNVLPRQLYLGTTEWITRDHTRLEPNEFEAHDQFYKAYGAAGRKPDLPSIIAWDPAMLLIASLRALGPEASAAQVNDHLSHLKDFAGLNGIYDFSAVPQRGLGGRDGLVTIWSTRDQTWQVVSRPGGEPLE